MKTIFSRTLTHLRASILLTFVAVVFALASTGFASAQDRTLYIHYTHTGETAHITFRRNGRYDQAGLRQLNTFLRDWRRNEPTNMDPALFDLVWSVYQEVGGTQPIYVVSAYRSPQTNELLRSRSSGVAKNSRHTQGKAMDFYIPGVSLRKVREAAMKFQVGGVGYYPTSGNPFVHLDTGNVRAWPRMTTAQLRNLFPNGKTLHVSSDGSVLSQSGRNFASAEWQKCNSVPCAPGNTAITQVTSGRGGGSGRTLLDMFFGNDPAPAPSVQVANVAPSQRTVTSVPVAPPVPAARASLLDLRTPATPPVPADLTAPIVLAMRTTTEILPDSTSIPPNVDQIAVASIAQDLRPTARVLLSNPAPAVGLLSAYAPTQEPEPNAQRALEILIERRDLQTNSPVNPAAELRGAIVTASLGNDIFDTISDLGSEPIAAPQNPPVTQLSTPTQQLANDMFASTFSAVSQNQATELLPMLDNASEWRTLPDYKMMAMPAQNVKLFEPDLDHVDQAFVEPVTMEGSHFAVLFQPEANNLSPQTELGAHANALHFSNQDPSFMPTTSFAAISPIFATAL